MALELVKKYCSRHGMSIDELVANQLVKSTYGDDGGAGGTKDQEDNTRRWEKT